MRSIPPINLTILHACSLSASGRQLAWALGIENQSTNATAKDRACAGFPEVVYASLFEADGTSGFLSQHATSVYKDIADGKTVWKAVDYAKSRPVTVPTVSRPWRVGTGLEGWKAWSAPATASLAPVAGKVPSTGAKANLLAVEGKAYRPGPALLRRRAKP